MPQENEAVRDGDVEEEVVHILVELPAPLLALVVPPELVTVVHSSHEPIVQNHSLWTWDSDPGSVELPSLHCRWLPLPSPPFCLAKQWHSLGPSGRFSILPYQVI